LSYKEIKADYNHLYYKYILSIQVIGFNGTDFAQAIEQEQASSFGLIYFRGLLMSWGSTSSRGSTVNAAKIKNWKDRTATHNYENEPGLSCQHGI